jgi:hypothetical protein
VIVHKNDPGRGTVKTGKTEWQCNQHVISLRDLGEIEKFNNQAIMAEQLTVDGSITVELLNRE